MERAPSQVLGGRARGVVVGPLIALSWAVFGLSGSPPVARYPLTVAAVVVTAVLLRPGLVVGRRSPARRRRGACFETRRVPRRSSA